jgi:hypothetical protein
MSKNVVRVCEAETMLTGADMTASADWVARCDMTRRPQRSMDRRASRRGIRVQELPLAKARGLEIDTRIDSELLFTHVALAH